MSKVRNLSISLLHGLRADTRQHLREVGIMRLDQIAALHPDELRQFKGIKTTAEGVHAHARAFVEDCPIWYGTLPDMCHDRGFMFDLETDPATSQPWSLGWSDSEAGTKILLVVPNTPPDILRLAGDIQATLVPDVATAWYQFADAVGDSGLIYHWSGYDAGILRSTAPLAVRKRLEGRMHDLLRTYNHTVKLPVSSASLKVVAAYLGFSWSGYAEWWQAFQDFHHWQHTGDIQVLEQACLYQRDDVVALGLVWQWMHDSFANPE